VLGEVRVTGVPIRFYATPGSVRLHPPLLGEHTRALLGELGYSAEEAQGLIRDGLVADNAAIEALGGARRT
jgi:crotonobetainyl-CoA:carnitine CoA-transferase CaiB-like acyl-CoA transferase